MLGDYEQAIMIADELLAMLVRVDNACAITISMEAPDPESAKLIAIGSQIAIDLLREELTTMRNVAIDGFCKQASSRSGHA